MNAAASALFPTAFVEHIAQARSDHIPIMLHCARPRQENEPHRQRPFRFEATWVRKHHCEEIVRQVWENPKDMDPVSEIYF